MAEDLADYLRELGVKVQYLHSEVDTLERVRILRDLRLGVFDVLVGINLLREGIDLPEVTLVAILDADKEGFLRSAWSLIQMIGRAARNTGGEVVMYADRVTESMRVAIDETDRRRRVQETYNHDHGIEPTTIVKEIHDINERLRSVAESTEMYVSTGERVGGVELATASRAQVEELVARMEADMRNAAKNLEFERAAVLRDEVQQIRLRVLEEDASAVIGRAAERAAAEGAAAEGAAAEGAAAEGAAVPAPPIQVSGQASGRRGRGARAVGAGIEVTTVTVLPAGETPDGAPDGALEGTLGGTLGDGAATASDWLPGIRDEHEEDTGWQARWLDRPTWDHTVTPNIRRRTGSRPPRRR
jgi:superfamily II DNA/RNA helicase